MEKITSFFGSKPDPVTGDMLSFSDRISWAAQGIIRRWTWVIGNIILSVVWWTHATWFGDDPDTLFKWMALYSLLAIVVESVVGIGMFQQTKRDAVMIRHIRKLVDSQQEQLAMMLSLLQQITAHEERIEDLEEEILEQETTYVETNIAT